MADKLRIFNYPGNKEKFVDEINHLVMKSESETYVEPFCGTASVLLNLPGSFDKYVINDWSREVIRIIKSFRDGEYSDLVKMYEEVADEFGSIQHDKESYYNFRNKGNERHFRKETLEEGFFLYMASRAAINSLFRIGPTGFNQSFGNRGGTLKLKEYEFNRIKSKLLDTTIYCQDYVTVLDIYDGPETLFFVDPPYVKRKVQGSYKDEDDFHQDYFLSLIKNLQGDVIYTDVYDDYIIEKLGPEWECMVLKDKKNVSPGRNQGVKTDYREVAYYKIKAK